jgi:nitroreductase
MNAQEVQVYAATRHGLFLFDPSEHRLQVASATDVRRVTGYQDFVDTAPLDLIFVADHGRMSLVPAAQRERYAYAAAGAMVQNVYLFCAASGLGTVVRAWFDHAALGAAMGLQADQQLLLCQTVGKPKPTAP